MLEGKLYSTLSYTLNDNNVKANLKLIRESSIFDGHFPETPIVPGVCSIQMIQELLEKATTKKLMLINADNVKFLGIINPDVTPKIDIELSFTCEHQFINATATIVNDENIFLKFKGQFKC